MTNEETRIFLMANEYARAWITDQIASLIRITNNLDKKKDLMLINSYKKQILDLEIDLQILEDYLKKLK